MVSTGYNPVRVSAPRRIASLPDIKDKKFKHVSYNANLCTM
jgi:hypothetical protein